MDGWGDPIHTWRRGVTAKLDAGQGEVELSNDLLIGARLLERVAAGVPRKLRDPLLEAAARLREPAIRSRAPARRSEEVEELLAQYPLRTDHPRRATRRLGGSAVGPVRFLV